MLPRRITVWIPIIVVLLFYGWCFVFKDDQTLRTLGASGFPIIGTIISFIWIMRAYRKTNEDKLFWLLLGLGIIFTFLGNFLWLYSLLAKGIKEFSNASFLFWFLSYIFYLLGLAYKTKKISNSGTNSPYLFNIMVFMTSAIVISIHYLIRPIWELWDNSVLAMVLTIAFPIANLSILFMMTYLYYLSMHSKERRVVFFLAIAFFFQIVADSTFLYLAVIGSYDFGSWIDPFWLISTLFIGYAALYAEKNLTEKDYKLENYVESKEHLFPYGSAIILLVFVLNSYEWRGDALTVGLIIIFLMIIVRQLVVLKKNKTLMSEFKYLAYHDSLTGLHNRTRFNEDLSKIMGMVRPDSSKVGLLLIDLDRFKLVNDTLGHLVGDKLLICASERLKQTIDEGHFLYRIGGDEFIIILPGTTRAQCTSLAEKIIIDLAKSFSIDNHEITITPSIGISLYPKNGVTSEQLLKNADAAMYMAKGKGRNNFCFYNSALNEMLSRKMKIENGLRNALRREQFSLNYQPIVELQTREIVGMEALLRWQHPEMGAVSPAEFIPIAEETGQIIAIGEWVLKTACQQNKVWQEAGFPALSVSVNVSVRQLQSSDFVETVKNILRETELEPQFLELEITESIQNVSETIIVLEALNELGVRSAIDDFGTGYSSLHILTELPINTIKIDKLFIDNLTEASDHPLIKTIIDIGLNLNLRIVAEGIESEQQVSNLTRFNCNFGQGFLFSKPVNAEQFEKLLTNQGARHQM
jgi:diguanylate cyclase (GGDEF)-like protein